MVSLICCLKTIKIVHVSSYSGVRIETTISTKTTSLLRCFSNFISCQCQGAARLDNFFLATKHGFIGLGTLTQKNYQFWCSENPKVFRETSSHSKTNQCLVSTVENSYYRSDFFTSTVDANTHHHTIYFTFRMIRAWLLVLTGWGPGAHCRRDAWGFTQIFSESD